MGYDLIRHSLDIESNLKSGVVRGGKSKSLTNKINGLALQEQG